MAPVLGQGPGQIKVPNTNSMRSKLTMHKWKVGTHTKRHTLVFSSSPPTPSGFVFPCFCCLFCPCEVIPPLPPSRPSPPCCCLQPPCPRLPCMCCLSLRLLFFSFVAGPSCCSLCFFPSCSRLGRSSLGRGSVVCCSCLLLLRAGCILCAVFAPRDALMLPR